VSFYGLAVHGRVLWNCNHYNGVHYKCRRLHVRGKRGTTAVLRQFDILDWLTNVTVAALITCHRRAGVRAQHPCTAAWPRGQVHQRQRHRARTGVGLKGLDRHPTHARHMGWQARQPEQQPGMLWWVLHQCLYHVEQQACHPPVLLQDDG
jgi:hypothetical protein